MTQSLNFENQSGYKYLGAANYGKEGGGGRGGEGLIGQSGTNWHNICTQIAVSNRSLEEEEVELIRWYVCTHWQLPSVPADIACMGRFTSYLGGDVSRE